MPTSLGPAEILVILVVALIVLGPSKLPQAGRQVGKALAEVRRWTTDVTSELKGAIDIDAKPPSYSKVTDPVVVSASTTGVDSRTEPPATEVVAPAAVPSDTTSVVTAPEAPAAASASASASTSTDAPPPTQAPESPPGDPARL